MLFAELKKIMPEGATDDQINAQLKIINDEAQALVDEKTNGLLTNKEKLLTQMTKLKENQIPEGFDAEGYAKYNSDKEEFDKKKKELEDQELEGKGQWEALKLKLIETNTASINTLKDESGATITNLQKALDKELIENASIKAIEKEKGNSLFLLPHMRGNMKTVMAEDGSYSVQITDGEGKPRFADDATTPFTVSDMVAELKANTDFAPAFPTQNGGGGGAPNGGGQGNSGVNPWKADSKNVTEQARINKENPTLAAQYKKAAGVE